MQNIISSIQEGIQNLKTQMKFLQDKLMISNILIMDVYWYWN